MVTACPVYRVDVDPASDDVPTEPEAIGCRCWVAKFGYPLRPRNGFGLGVGVGTRRFSLEITFRVGDEVVSRPEDRPDAANTVRTVTRLLTRSGRVLDLWAGGW